MAWAVLASPWENSGSLSHWLRALGLHIAHSPGEACSLESEQAHRHHVHRQGLRCQALRAYTF